MLCFCRVITIHIYTINMMHLSLRCIKCFNRGIVPPDPPSLPQNHVGNNTNRIIIRHQLCKVYAEWQHEIVSLSPKLLYNHLIIWRCFLADWLDIKKKQCEDVQLCVKMSAQEIWHFSLFSDDLWQLTREYGSIMKIMVLCFPRKNSKLSWKCWGVKRP